MQKAQEKIINVVVVKVRISLKMVITAAVHYNIIVEIVEFIKYYIRDKNIVQKGKEELIKSYYERGSMRGISRIFGVSPLTLKN